MANEIHTSQKIWCVGEELANLPTDLLHKLRGLFDWELNSIQFINNTAHLVSLQMFKTGIRPNPKIKQINKVKAKTTKIGDD